MTAPSRDDGATMACPVCGASFVPSGRRRFCTESCRKAAYRRRHQPLVLPLPAPPTRSARAETVYECPQCDTRYLGQQRCEDCGVFCRRVGPGGLCVYCDEPLAVSDLVTSEVMPLQ